jgi:hypothetical protein
LLPCEKEEAAVVEYLRSGREATLVRIDPANLRASEHARAA